MPKTAEYRAQFWSRIDRRVECWAPMWYLPRAKQCYVRDPSLGPGRKRSAQFIAYTLEIGPVPADSFVRPSCGTPACVRPQHLTLATQHTVNAKLTLKQVQALRAERANNPKGTTLAGLAKKYKISVPSIARILAGTNYRQASGGVPVRLPLKVSPQTVRALRAERVTDPHGTTIAGLAKKYKISAGTVAGILYGRLYRAVTGGIPVLRPSEQA